MKLRPYLRGLGIGIIVTAIILHFSLKTANGASMTDSEIKARAAELGMIENTVLSNTVSQGSVSLNLSDDAEETTTDTVSDVIDLALLGEDQGDTEDISDTETFVSDDEQVDDNEVTDDTDAQDTTSEDTPEDTADQDDTGSEPVTPVDTPVNYVTITVVAGDSSYSVAKKVYDAGLITSAALFDEYLCAGGYDRSISIGQHRVPVDATDEEIAKILTSGD